MRRLLAALVVVCVAASLSAANGYRKSYFGATPPGAWANYKTSVGSYGDTVDSMKRLKDDEGRVRFAYTTEYMSGQFKGTKAKGTYTMEKTYPADREGLDYLRHIVAGTADAEGQTIHFDDTAIKGIRNVPAYGPALVFEATEMIDGKETDRYGYTIQTPTGPETGKYWLSDKVPFGIVKMMSTSKDATGTVNKIEKRLTASGVSAPEEPKASSKKPSKSKKKSRG
jgi:hypothetical protein